MIKKILNWFKKSESEEIKPLTTNDSQKFELVYKDLIIGYLVVFEEKWKFYYSEEFKSNSEFNYISGFPDLNKVYTNDSLWPFFKIRIPGLKQPSIKATIKKENIAENDEIALLKRFGKKTISNPYLLIPVS
jgi:HipA-like protein